MRGDWPAIAQVTSNEGQGAGGRPRRWQILVSRRAGARLFRDEIDRCSASIVRRRCIACGARAAGARFADLELNTYPVLAPVRVTTRARAAARTLADRLRERDGAELSVDALLDSPHVFFGTIEQLVEKCLGLRERFGISYIMVAGEAEAFAPVVERLAGR